MGERSLRRLLIPVIIFNASSFIWFLLGATAFFQRGLDIVGTSVLCFEGIPVLLFFGLFAILLIKRWTPTRRGQYISFFTGLVVSILLSVALIQSVNTYGWAEERIYSDTLKITPDQKYDYRIDIINAFQKNCYAQLYLKDVDSGKELYIPVDIQTRKIVGLVVGKVNHWVMLEPTDNSFQRYILYTTRELGIPEEKFKIDTIAGTSSRMN